MRRYGRGENGVRKTAGRAIFGAILLFVVYAVFADTPAIPKGDPGTGSVIFIHPDGSGTGAWTALRLVDHGPDGLTNWDRMEALGFYRGHLADSPVSSSHGGATTHAWGVKADFLHYGSNESSPLASLSGKPYSILMEAKAAGKAVGIVNSGHMAEPGTGVFAASAPKRGDTDTICEQVIHCGADVIMGGGETLLLPVGVRGRHGEQGTRQDGKNLIEIARQLGYTVVYDREELKAVPPGTGMLLGVFAPLHTFNAKSEEILRQEGLPLYQPGAPTIAEMTEAALQILGRNDSGFLLVVEEEGTDNFGNSNNAGGTIEALRRADAAIGVAMEFVENNPSTLLITAADSDAGGMKVTQVYVSESDDRPLPANASNGAPIDGRDGSESYPFLSAPDRAGTRFPFAVAWAGYDDLGGGIIARAHGLNADLLPQNVDNTDVYRMMYATLFGVWLP
jgi:alkaline phosphatase